MNTSAFQIMKDSCIFLWNHKRIILAIVLFAGVAVAIAAFLCAILLAGALLIIGTDALLLLFHNFAAGIFPLLTPWLVCILGAGLFLGMLLVMFYPRVCTAYYVLSLLRSEPVTIWQAFGFGVRQTVAAWRVVAGMTLFPLMVLTTAAVLLLLFGLVGIIFSIVGLSALLWFLAAIYFVEQLVADGAVDFIGTVATSWNYVKRSWWQVFGVCFLLWVVNLICSFALSSYIFPLVGFVMSAWYSVATNKIYLIARSESTYKYSSE